MFQLCDPQVELLHPVITYIASAVDSKLELFNYYFVKTRLKS